MTIRDLLITSDSLFSASDALGSEGRICLNIFSPPDGLGGFGDLVSNLYMAEQLGRLGKYKVNLFVDSTYSEKLSALFEGKYPDNQEVGCILVPESLEGRVKLLESLPAPSKETKYISFSSRTFGKKLHPADGIPEHLLEFFLDKGDRSSVIAMDEYLGSVSLMHLIAKKEKSLTLYSGPLGLGMYIAAKKPEIEIDCHLLLKKYFGTIGLEVDIEHVEIGFCYTFLQDMSSLYVKALREWASKNREKQFFLISQRPIELDLSLVENLHICCVKNLPFEETKKIIASSTIPIMVTGDMSLTLALEYEKVMFYEQLDHKFPIDVELRYFPELKDLPSLSFRTDLSPSYHKQFMDGFEWNQNNRNYFADGFSGLRKRLSLPEKFDEIIRGSDLRLEMLNIFHEEHILNGARCQWIQEYLPEEKFKSNNKFIRAYVLKCLKFWKIPYKLLWSDPMMGRNFENNFRAGSGINWKQIGGFLSEAKEGVTLSLLKDS